MQSSTHTITVKRGHKEQTDDGRRWRWVHDPDTQERVQITVDLDRIAQYYGQKAVDNKTGRCCDMNGCVVVKHLR